jgi:hypothetical protein
MPFKILAATLLAASLAFPVFGQDQTSTPCPQTAAQKAANARNKVGGWLNKATGGTAPIAGNPAGCPADSSQTAQTTPATAPTGGTVVAAGTFSGTFLSGQGSVRASNGKSFSWKPDPRTSNPQIDGYGFTGALETFFFDGKQASAEVFYLHGERTGYVKVVISGGKFTVSAINEKDIPATGLLNADGTPKDNGLAAPAGPIMGSLQIIPWGGPQLAQMGYKDAERIARLTIKEGAAITVIQNHNDAKNFWRVTNDPFKAYLYETANNEVTPLLRGTDDPAGTWKMLDSAGNVKGKYKEVK